MTNRIILTNKNGDECIKEKISFIHLIGSNNVVKLKIGSIEDIENLKGLFIMVYGNNNTINIGKCLFPSNPPLGLTGLAINVGNPPEDTIDPDTPRYASNCRIDIDDNVIFCGARLFLQDDNSSISIGKDCMFSWGIDVWCTDVHTITDLSGNPLNYGKSIEIGSHVWVGKDVKIGKNTKISNDSIIGWGSIVTKKFEKPNVIIAGNPAKVVKKEINWNYRDLQNYKIYRKSNFPANS